MRAHPLQKLIQHHKKDKRLGIYSVCSANQYVIEAAINFARQQNSYLIIEATSNQVDQYGGYTGMKPQDFKLFVYERAHALGYDEQRLILGGDHLGPNVWQNEEADPAMKKAAVQVRAYVKAGFSKIHLDTSMPCQGDQLPLSTEVIAERAAFLCRVAEETNRDNPQNTPLVYIIGSEVPVPGGAHEQLDKLAVSRPDDVNETIQLTKKAFIKLNLHEAWERVIAVVVQPGVEFSNWSVVKYDPLKAKDLSQAITDYENLCYEAHSTDYQSVKDLTSLVQDHFVILKVGPGLTFALREGIFALAYIEDELYSSPARKNKRSNILSVIDEVMDENPQYWKKYYSGQPDMEYYNRRFGLSDRIRYYLPDARIRNALKTLIHNLSQQNIPQALLSQFLPEQFKKIKNAELEWNPNVLISDKIGQVLSDYALACSAKDNYALLT